MVTKSRVDNPKVAVKETNKYGKGVFAAAPIKQGERIASFDGPVFAAKTTFDLPNNPPLFVRNHAIQFEQQKYRDSMGIARFVNHSCNPNCGIKNTFDIVAMRPIQQGEEITFDYAMTENNDWEMECTCGDRRCRVLIKGFDFLPEQQRSAYRGYISSWLLARPTRQKKIRKKDAFAEIERRAHAFADFLVQNRLRIARALESYEPYVVIIDELFRSVDYLRNLERNRDCFVGTVGRVVSFLPINQPLYALVCFALVPSFLAKELHVRYPHAAHVAARTLVKELALEQFFPHVSVSFEKAKNFVKNQRPKADVVIFTGTYGNSEKVRHMFPRLKFFIYNGVGINPVIVTKNAQLDYAVSRVVKLCTYNEGQDCSAPKAILVDAAVLSAFVDKLRHALADLTTYHVGYFMKRDVFIGPSIEPQHLASVASFFSKNSTFCIFGGSIDFKSGIITPTAFVKPMKNGKNYSKFFAPIIMIHPFNTQTDLAEYFADARYHEHAMYVTVFGKDPLVHSILQSDLHPRDQIFIDTDLLREERGFLPYGGFGPKASSVTVRGKKIVGTTLAQRDIFLHLLHGKPVSRGASDSF